MLFKMRFFGNGSTSRGLSNVLISDILFGGKPREILRHGSSGKITNVTSTPLMKKIEDVLRRPFGLGEAQVYGIIRLFRDTFSIVSPERDLSVVTADPDDNRILEAASATGADDIISGDTHLPDLAEWNGIPVLTPDTFLQKFLSA